MPLTRPPGSLEKSACTSPFAGGQGWFRGRLRDAALADHWLKSEVEDMGVPLDCAPFERVVETEELDEADDIDEDELDRERVWRGPNMPRTSSEFMELLPSIEPHAGREIWEIEGGLATAVMSLNRTPNFRVQQIDRAKFRLCSSGPGASSCALPLLRPASASDERRIKEQARESRVTSSADERASIEETRMV